VKAGNNGVCGGAGRSLQTVRAHGDGLYWMMMAFTLDDDGLMMASRHPDVMVPPLRGYGAYPSQGLNGPGL
jgi:hypothetical protein